jgi:hypothetical protein
MGENLGKTMETQMKRFLCALLLVCMLGCDGEIRIDLGDSLNLPTTPSIPERPERNYPDYEPERPTVNLEVALRQGNWLGSQGEGSCVHATMIMLFRWQGRDDLAEVWRTSYENGEWHEGLAAKFEKERVRYAYTWKENDVQFLEWACKTRRGCGVTVRGGAHMVMLVHLDAKQAGILDNNSVNQIKWVPRETFLSEWYNSNSWAVTPVYTPPPPLPSKEPIE